MSTLQINKSVVKKINLVNNATRQTIVNMRFTRDENGLKIYCKSPVFESYFSKFNDEQMNQDDYVWCDYVSYGYITHRGDDDEFRDCDFSLNTWGSTVLFNRETFVNVSWLRAKGIKNGITIQFNNNPIHNNTYIKYVQSVLEFIEKFYNDWIRPKNSTGKITSKLKGDLA